MFNLFKKLSYLIFFLFISTSFTYAESWDTSSWSLDVIWPIATVEYSSDYWTKEDVIVSITCSDIESGCDIYDINWWNSSDNIYTKTFTSNESWSIDLKDNVWNFSNIAYWVVNIDKDLPVWTLELSSTGWTNSDITATLKCIDNTSWCDSAIPVVWIFSDNWNKSLSIKDVAWNVLTQSFLVENIDKIAPTYHIEYETIQALDTTQKFIVKCIDEHSWCINSEEYYEKPLNSVWVLEISDYAWNIVSFFYSTAKSSWDFSDRELDWVSWSRTIWLSCRDEFSWCIDDYVEELIIVPTPSASLTVSDRAWNTVTRNYEILKIDNRKPLIFTTKLTFNDYWKASDANKLKLFSKDLWGSWLEMAKYIWDNNDCINSWKDFTVNERINFTVSWNHRLYLCAKDKAWNIKEYSKDFMIYPWDIEEDNSRLIVNSIWDKFANDKDYYYYTIILKDKYDNSIYDKNIKNIQHDVGLLWKKLFTNMVDKSWSETIDIFWYNLKSNQNWEINFNLKSISPWEYSQNFSFMINSWWNNYIDNSDPKTIISVWIDDLNIFKKPILWELLLSDQSWIPKIGTLQKYEINLINTWSLSLISNWNLDISKDLIIHKTEGHFWDTFNDKITNFWSNVNAYLWFNWVIWVNDNILSGVNISTDKLIVAYKYEWKNISYYLNDFWIKSCAVNTLWLRVNWVIQWAWKANMTWQLSNFSDISKWEQRLFIRKNWYKLIENMSNWDVINWVKYIEWNIDIYWDNLWYETLVVKNWNVIISWDLNISWKKLWIIVLKDNYLVESDYNNLWNIYINKNVENISALIYADGVFRSAKSNGGSYSDDELIKVLKLKGSLFTRNTIWGAVKWNSSYLLPWWTNTNIFNLAEIYDLNYTRKVPNTCSLENDYSFLIEDYSQNKIDTPIWFNKQ